MEILEDSFLDFIEKCDVFVVLAVILGERHIAADTGRIIVFILLDDFLRHIFHVVFGHIPFLVFRDFIDLHQVLNRVTVDIQVKPVFATFGSGILRCHVVKIMIYVFILHS